MPLEDTWVLGDVVKKVECAVQEVRCQVVECRPLGASTYRVQLRMPDAGIVNYYAGQYLQIQREDGAFSAYSLASPPQWGALLELHVEVREDSGRHLPNYLQHTGEAVVRLPFGDTHLAELPGGPLVLVAGGTGMAQMQSLIEHCRASHAPHPLTLYWSVTSPEEFYELPLWTQWQALPWLTLVPMVRESTEGWNGRSGSVHSAICADFTDLSAVHVYASGSPTLVYSILDALVAAGLPAQQMHADVFSYAPRN